MISSLLLNLPTLSRYLTMFSALVLFKPETYINNALLAVFTFTPTLLTACVTTKFRLSFNFLGATSCWYWPTPILLGSILTNSDKGSWSRLAIDAADLSSTLKSGNSSLASSLAE